MSTEIYYFSGTGNSLSVAKDIAEKTGGTLIPIASLMDRSCINTDADVIGIIFPVYYMEPPMIIAEFARKLKDIKGKYIFAVCTYGGAAGASLRMLKRFINSSGGVLSAAYGVCMPQNSFPKPNEDHQVKYMEWKRKLELIIKNIDIKAKGIFYANFWLEIALIPIHIFIIKPICKRHFKRISRLPPDSKYEEHKHAMDRNFNTNENCNGCGICSKVCPVGNIILNDNKPVWQNHCEHCLACYNWCPNNAIQGGITSKGYYYRHPGIKLSEIIEQK